MNLVEHLDYELIPEDLYPMAIPRELNRNG